MTGRRRRASALALLLILALASGLADAADATRRAPRRLLQQRPSGSARPQRTTRAARAAAPTPAVSRDGVLAGEDARRAAPVARVTAPPSSATPSLGGARVAGNLDYEDVPADPKNEAVPERSDTDRDRVVVVPTPAPAPVVVSSGATAQPARQTRTSWDDDDDDEEEEEDGDDDEEDGDDEDGEEDDEEGEEEDEKEGEAARDPGARPRPRTSPGDVGPSRNAPQTRVRDAFPPRPPAPARKPRPAPRPPWPPWPAEPDAPWPPPAPRPPRPARTPTPTAAAAATTPSAATTSSATTTPSGTPSGTPARPRRPEDAAGNATEVAGARELDSKQPDASEKAAAAYEAMLAYMKAKEEEEEKKTEKEKETETEVARGNETSPETSPETRPEDPAKDTAVNRTQPAAAEAHAAEGDETGVPGVGVAEVPGAVGASAAARGGGGGDTAGASDPGSELVVSESDGRSPPVGLALIRGPQLAAGVAAFGCVGLIAAVWAARRATSGPHSSLERGWSSVKLPSGFRAKDNNAGGGEKDVRYRELQMTEEAATEGVGGSSSSSSSNEGRRGGRKKGGRRMTTEEESFYDL